MAFFRNSAVNLLNLHYGVFSIAISGGGAFFCVYLLRAGVPLTGVLEAMAAILLVRFVVRPAVVPLAVRYGLQRLVVAGTLLIAAQFIVIASVHGVGPALYALVLISALGDTVYWSSYHAYFAALGDREHRGHQIGAREAIAAMTGIASPLATGWILVAFSPWAAFGASAAITALGAAPLLWTPRVSVARDVQGAWKASIPGVKLFLTDGWISAGWVFVWQIALFVSLEQSFVNYGGALAVAALVGATAGMLLGRHIDAGHGGAVVLIALGTLAAIIVMRAAAAGHPTFAIIANALASVGTCIYIPTMMTAVYNQAQRSPCALRFHVATEGGWDVGGASGCLTSAALLHFGLPISAALLLPLIGVAAAFVQLRTYYAAHVAVRVLGVERETREVG